MFKVSIFRRGDLIIDKVLNRHGIITEVKTTTLQIKWIKKPGQIFRAGAVESFRTQYIRNKILKGEIVHQEKKDNTEEG